MWILWLFQPDSAMRKPIDFFDDAERDVQNEEWMCEFEANAFHSIKSRIFKYLFSHNLRLKDKRRYSDCDSNSIRNGSVRCTEYVWKKFHHIPHMMHQYHYRLLLSHLLRVLAINISMTIKLCHKSSCTKTNKSTKKKEKNTQKWNHNLN